MWTRAKINEVSLVLKSITVLINTLKSAQQDPSIKGEYIIDTVVIEHLCYVIRVIKEAMWKGGLSKDKHHRQYRQVVISHVLSVCNIDYTHITKRSYN